MIFIAGLQGREENIIFNSKVNYPVLYELNKSRRERRARREYSIDSQPPRTQRPPRENHYSQIKIKSRRERRAHREYSSDGQPPRTQRTLREIV